MGDNSGQQMPLLFGGYVYRLSGFVAGPNLEAVHAVSQLVTNPPEMPVVYVWGAVGSGKTHLLQAACAEAGERSLTVAYLPLREVANGLSTGICESLETLELIAVDDVHAVAGEAEWEHALFSLFNRVREANGRILISAEHSPRELRLDLADLRSRLSWGVVHRLGDLTDKQKILAMRTHAKARGIELPDEVAWYLLGRTPRNLGKLCALIEQLDIASLAEQRKLTIPFVKVVCEL